MGQQTLLQSGVLDEYRGRVLAASGTTASLLSLAGAATAGALGDALGVVLMLNVSAGLFIAAGLVSLMLPATDLGTTSP